MILDLYTYYFIDSSFISVSSNKDKEEQTVHRINMLGPL